MSVVVKSVRTVQKRTEQKRIEERRGAKRKRGRREITLVHGGVCNGSREE